MRLGFSAVKGNHQTHSNRKSEEEVKTKKRSKISETWTPNIHFKYRLIKKIYSNDNLLPNTAKMKDTGVSGL